VSSGSTAKALAKRTIWCDVRTFFTVIKIFVSLLDRVTIDR